jgi:uncharacterized protein (TIRG00374 family)
VPSQKISQVAKYLVSLLLAAGLLYWLYKGQNTDEIMRSLRTADYAMVGLSLLFSYLAHYIRGWRWVMTLQPSGFNVSKADGFWAVMIGYLANLVVPRMGEVTRCAILNKTGKVPVSLSFGTVIAERVFDLIALATIAVLTILLEYEKIGDFVLGFLGKSVESFSGLRNVFLAVVFLAVVAIWAFMRWRHLLAEKPFFMKIVEFVGGIKTGLLSVMKLKRNLFFLYVAQTFFIWFFYWLTAYAVLQAVPETASLNLIAALTVMMMSSLGMAVPIQGGFGVVHALLAFALTAYGIDGNFAASFALLAHSSQVISIVFGGLAALLVVQLRSGKKTERHSGS